MSFAITLLRGSTMVVELSVLQDTTKQVSDPSRYPTNATADLDVFDPIDGTTPISGATDIQLTYDNTTSGAATIYRGEIAAAAALVPGVYPARMTITVGTKGRVMRGTCTVRDG